MTVDYTHYITLKGQIGLRVCVRVCITSLAWPPLIYESGKEITN